MVSVSLFKAHRQRECARRTTDLVVSEKRLLLVTFSPAPVRQPFAAAVAETARHIRRSLLPLIFPPEQSATLRSLCRIVDRSGQGHRQTGGPNANRSISHEPRCAPFRTTCRAFALRLLT